MNRAEQFRFSDFTRSNYRKLLGLAKQRYVFRSFENFIRGESFVLWRHDVDFSMHAAARLAEIEHDEGVQATYFVHLHNEFYNLLESTTWARLKRIIAQGHSIGLHFDAHFYRAVSKDGMLEKFLPL